jgi:hypothetical protein
VKKRCLDLILSENIPEFAQMDWEWRKLLNITGVLEIETG